MSQWKNDSRRGCGSNIGPDDIMPCSSLKDLALTLSEMELLEGSGKSVVLRDHPVFFAKIEGSECRSRMCVRGLLQ